MTLRARLALGLIGIALVLLVPLAITLRALDQLNDQAQVLRAGDFQASIILGRLREAALEVKTAETALLFVSDSGSRSNLTRSVGKLQALSDSLASFELGGPAQRLRAAVGEVAVAVPELIDAVRRGSNREADAIADDRTGPALQRAENGIAITERSLLVRTQERVVRIGDSTGQAVSIAALALAAAVLVATMLAVWLLRSIARPVFELERGMAAIAEGEFGHKVDIDPDRGDEFGRLSAGYIEMRRRLHELNKMQAEFISVASHELKTPVNVMVGYLQLLQEGVYGDLAPKQREILHTVETQGHTLGRLTKHLLDISRFEAGGSRIEPRPMRLGKFLEDLERAFHVLALQREVTFTVSKDERLSDEVLWDADRMNEVVGNLLANAFKFTPRGGRVELRAEPHDTEGVTLSVIDTGAGIPTEQLPQVFNKFFQADNQKSASHEGTGLGLSIAKEIVEAHRGTIRCNSVVGEGTEFRLVLPRIVDRRSVSHMAAPVEAR